MRKYIFFLVGQYAKIHGEFNGSILGIRKRKREFF